MKWGKKHVNERRRSDRKREERSFGSFQRGKKVSSQGVYGEKVTGLGRRKVCQLWGRKRERDRKRKYFLEDVVRF